jgi:SAM-dependent methyltransferase
MRADGYEQYAAIADLYDHVVPYRARTDVAFFVDAARESGGPVLEVGCGTGRVLIPTARAGIDITGLDASTDMLAVCRERLQGEPEAVQSRAQLVMADMRSFDLGGAFALVTVPFRPFQHLTTVDEQLSCLASFRRHLRREGTLILDLFNPSLEALAREVTQEEAGDEPDFTTPDGRHVVRRFRIVAHDRREQTIQVQQIYHVTHADGRTERLVHAFPMRYLFRFEIEHLLVRAGFTVQQIYSDYDKHPYGSTYPGELVVVAGVAP